MSTMTTRGRPRPPVQTKLAPDYRAILAMRLDLLAGFHLQQGFHGAAELLAVRAEKLREGVR